MTKNWPANNMIIEKNAVEKTVDDLKQTKRK